jgi:hypothetical protein
VRLTAPAKLLWRIKLPCGDLDRPQSFGVFMKPTVADIAVVTGKIEARDWLGSGSPVSEMVAMTLPGQGPWETTVTRNGGDPMWP